MLDLWSGLLKGYGEGQDALSNGLKSAIDSLPLASESGLGQWAADLFESSLSALGLEPVDLSPQKAALINTAHIMSQDDSNFSLRLLSIKEEVLSAADTDSLFTDALSSAESSITDAIGSARFHHPSCHDQDHRRQGGDPDHHHTDSIDQGCCNRHCSRRILRTQECHREHERIPEVGIDGTDSQAERIARPDDDRVRPPLPRHAHDRPYRLQQHPLPIRMRVVRPNLP